MIIKKIKKNRGFVILFAVMLSSIILSIALGVASIALKEVKFGTSAKFTNEAFFAADTGIECALMNDKFSNSSFVSSGSGTIQCLGNTITLNGSFPSWNFTVTGLGSSGEACAKVSVFKDDTTSPPSILTTTISKGYNTGYASCSSSNADRLERELKISY